MLLPLPLEHLFGVAARGAAAQVGDAQVARVHEANELRVLVIQECVRPNRIARAPPRVGKPRPDVRLSLVGRRLWVPSVAVDGSPAGTVSGFECGSCCPRWHVMQPGVLLARAASGVCRARSKPRSSSGTGNASLAEFRMGDAMVRRCLRTAPEGSWARATGPSFRPGVPKRMATRMSIASGRAWVARRRGDAFADPNFGMRGQPPR